MKKIFTIASLLFVFSVSAFSQTTFGVKAGLTNASWKGQMMSNLDDLTGFTKGIVNAKPVTGIYAGGFVETPLSDKFSIQTGAYYSRKGYSMKGEVAGKNLEFLGAQAVAAIQSTYIDIPALAQVEVAKGLRLYAGPQFSYLVKNNLQLKAGLLGISVFKTNIDITDQFNRADWSLVGGASYTFENGFSVNAGFDRGLSKLDKNGMTNTRNEAVKVGIGFTF